VANIGLSYPNRAIGATYSGGSWLAGLPAANAGTRDLAQVARSTNDDTASTVLQIDLGAAYPLRAFALVNHNLSSAATWEVDLGSSSGGTQVLNGSAVDAWQLSAFDTTVAALGVDDGAYQRSDYAAILVLGQAYTARYITIRIADTTNADGYVQLGMVWAGGLFVPAVNPVYGALQHTHVDQSTLARTESGAVLSTARRRLRRASFTLPALSESEADVVHEMQRVVGMADDVLYVPDVADAAKQQRLGFVGQMTEMRPLEYPHYAHIAKGFALTERGV
jgi:hypothetical protein